MDWDIFVFEDFIVTEDIALDLILEISVSDDVSIFEIGEIRSFAYINDPVLVEESVEIYLEVLNIEVSDDITYEDIVLGIEQDTIQVFAYEDILVQEDVERNKDNECELSDSLYVNEFVNIAPAIYFLSVSEDINISEYYFSLSICYFEEYDPVFIQDVVELTVGRAVFASRLITVTEYLNIAREILYVDVNNSVSIVEYTILGRSEEPMIAITNISVAEVVSLETAVDLAFNDFLRSYPFQEETITNVVVEVFENGAEQRRDKWGRTRKRFQVNFAPRSKDEIDQIKAFFVSRRGPANAFDFVNPLDNIDYVVRFEENSLKIARVAFGIYSASVNIVEVFI